MVEDLLFIKKKGFFMHTIKIIADSTCDLSEELLEQYDIGIIPLCIVMGEKAIMTKRKSHRKKFLNGLTKITPHPKQPPLPLKKRRKF